MISGTCGIEEASRALGIGRSLGYELAQQGRFPVRVLRVGRLYRVPVAELRRLLGETDQLPIRNFVEAQPPEAVGGGLADR